MGKQFRKQLGKKLKFFLRRRGHANRAEKREGRKNDAGTILFADARPRHGRRRHGSADAAAAVRRAPGGAEGRRCRGADHHGCGAETEALTARCCGGPPQHFLSRRAAGLAGTEKPCYNYGRISAKKTCGQF